MEESVRRVWAALGRESARLSGSTISDLFGEPDRVERFTFGAGELRADFSRQRIDEQVLHVLLELVRASDLEQRRDDMFSGARLNATEQRPVLHVALRAPANTEIIVDGVNVVPHVRDTIERMARLVDELTTSGVETVVNIGIGGSDLGPAMAARALEPFATTGMRSRFVSNVDPADLADCLSDLDPTTTAFVVASKTFTTQSNAWPGSSTNW